MNDHLDRGRERIEAGDIQVRKVLSLLDAHLTPAGGWAVKPEVLRDLFAGLLSIRVAARGGAAGPRGPLLNVQPHRGQPGHFWGTCPWCARAGVVDQEQFEGRVSIECPCGYHETHDHRTPARAA